MWVKLLKSLRFEKRTLLAGMVLWLRRAGKVERKPDGSYGQACSVYTFEDHDEEFILVLPDEAEGDLFVQTDQPVAA